MLTVEVVVNWAFLTNMDCRKCLSSKQIGETELTRRNSRVHRVSEKYNVIARIVEKKIIIEVCAKRTHFVFKQQNYRTAIETWMAYGCFLGLLGPPGRSSSIDFLLAVDDLDERLGRGILELCSDDAEERLVNTLSLATNRGLIDARWRWFCGAGRRPSEK